MKEWYRRKEVRIAVHITAWVIFFLVPVLLRPEFRRNGTPFIYPPFFTFENILVHLFLIFIFYLNAFVLVPRFLDRKRIIEYVLLVLSVFFIAALTSFLFRINPHAILFRPPFIFTFFSVAFVLAVSIVYRFILDRWRAETLQQLEQNERLKTELSFLRSQISPHFIFNILNSAVSLARVGSDQLEPTLIRLSNLLRYMLYNSDDEKVPLSQEIEYLENYIDLQRIRFEEDVWINFRAEGKFTGHVIEPMLLIPFVENAFKHGVGRINDPEIQIDLQEEEGLLKFHVRNKFGREHHELKDKNSGIGLANVSKRLELLYEDRYSLDVQVRDEWFDVKLNLVLK